MLGRTLWELPRRRRRLRRARLTESVFNGFQQTVNVEDSEPRQDRELGVAGELRDELPLEGAAKEIQTSAAAPSPPCLWRESTMWRGDMYQILATAPLQFKSSLPLTLAHRIVDTPPLSFPSSCC